MADTIMPVAKKKSDIGLIGLAVMGQNLALNIADHGFRTSVFNRTTDEDRRFVQKKPGHARRTGRTQDPQGVRRLA